MTLSQTVLQTGQRVSAAEGASLADTLIAFVRAFVGRPYDVRTSALLDSQRARTEPFACVVFHSTKNNAAVPPAQPVPASYASTVIDGHVELSLHGVRAAYRRIAAAKRLHDSTDPPHRDHGHRNELLGIVLGLRTDLALTTIAEEMRRLNEHSPASEWPDMVVVANTGLVQYSAQFPGEKVMGDFFLPNTTHSRPAPMYVVMGVRPTAGRTLNRMLAYVVAHLALSAPGAAVPPFREILDGVPNTCITLTGYQFDLAGVLRPVPRQFYNDRFLPPRPFLIQDETGRTLADAQFLPWQDGGVIRLRGELPLEMLLAFLGPKARGASMVRRPDAQISFALPITKADFLQALQRLHQQSNMVVRPEEPDWVVKKFSDEGSSSPFMARLLIGICKLRDAALPERAQRDTFDDAYDSVLSPLLDARARAKTIATLWHGHARRVAAGEVVRLQAHAIHVDENVDRDLSDELNAFAAAATRALKTGMQAVATHLGQSIGFLFQKAPHFAKHAGSLAASDPALADYLRHVRAAWSETLVGRRNAIEHDGWQLPNVLYQRDRQIVKASEPILDDQPITVFAASMLDRLTCFVEDVTAHLLQKRMTDGIAITEVPLPERDAETPERFRVTLAVGDLPLWRIAYHADEFERR